jgi:hypothetical protein
MVLFIALFMAVFIYVTYLCSAAMADAFIDSFMRYQEPRRYGELLHAVHCQWPQADDYYLS